MRFDVSCEAPRLAENSQEILGLEVLNLFHAQLS